MTDHAWTCVTVVSVAALLALVGAWCRLMDVVNSKGWPSLLGGGKKS